MAITNVRIYIQVKKKISKPQLISAANNLAAAWGLTPAEAAYRVMCEGLVKENNKLK